jgi:hypothetical protein
MNQGTGWTEGWPNERCDALKPHRPGSAPADRPDPG